MADLTTHYLGLKLRNPLIVSSSGLTSTVEKIKQLEELGAGAVVLKSLFEEQIKAEAGLMLEPTPYPEAQDYILQYTKSNSLEEYLQLIEKAKQSVRIPVIASINCISASEWTSFAEDIENAGADAIELNIYFLPTDKDSPSEKNEELYYNVITKVRKKTRIPVSVKIGMHFTNLVKTIHNLYVRGANGVVIFNRFYAPDIDIDKMKITAAEVFSSPSDIRNSLRWVGIISDQVENIDIAASTGVHDGAGAIKQILAGAKAVQLCSVLYKKGVEKLAVIKNDIESWMGQHQFDSIEEFRGKLNYRNIPDPTVYERSQFMKYFSSHV
ncbi:MAG: dihydroorotate dehydrogenase-like protein [Bacteroidales bacterium]|nr:dihydroorotate dehydrogenase-like protein [Bacteroidales bacterium]MBN2763657.1 dihydroorotate dehydrogenase-like protein [Bacteroidales bacterium]